MRPGPKNTVEAILELTRARHQAKIYAYVLMPEHVHLLFTPAADVTLERTIQFIRGGYSHSFGQRFGKHKEVWQKGFTDHRIRDAARILSGIASISTGIRLSAG